MGFLGPSVLILVKTFDNELKINTLVLSAQQNYIVNKVLASNEGNLLAICGLRGVSIIELPRRWGINGPFQNGKDRIICRNVPENHSMTDNSKRREQTNEKKNGCLLIRNKIEFEESKDVYSQL
uniref:CSON009001 protein n=1 Tax=Culicoides sonorensis TaxID=179676 RepID=A0A336MZD4_CULSO